MNCPKCGAMLMKEEKQAIWCVTCGKEVKDLSDIYEEKKIKEVKAMIQRRKRRLDAFSKRMKSKIDDRLIVIDRKTSRSIFCGDREEVLDMLGLTEKNLIFFVDTSKKIDTDDGSYLIRSKKNAWATS